MFTPNLRDQPTKGQGPEEVAGDGGEKKRDQHGIRF
jgi:hypothetical protein